jgi:predicted Holliday junction resolvase-like endonuclease
MINYTLSKENEKLRKQLSEKNEFIRNSYKKFGRTFEKFVPFTKNFPADLSTVIFVGKPIDFIAFEDDKITFIEVKTGRAYLTKNQAKIKQLVNEGKIEFKEVRY